MTILATSFINGIGSMTNVKVPRSAQMKEISNLIFDSIDDSPDDIITFDELKEWVELNDALMQLLSVYEPEI
jgi:hypothetical protein